MSSSPIYLTISALLTTEQIIQVRELCGKASYLDGALTAFDAAREVKKNLQVDTQCQEYLAIQNILLTAMNNSQLFRNATLPKNVYPFLISRYTEGMNYGWHVDSPLMGNMMRTDVAVTIFLNNPEEYDGGELELQGPSGPMLYKLQAGDAICYPCTQLHRVREVTRGQRCVAVTWIQSMVKSSEQRKVLFDLQQVIDTLRTNSIAPDEANLLQQNQSNLMRMWVE